MDLVQGGAGPVAVAYGSGGNRHLHLVVEGHEPEAIVGAQAAKQ